MCLFAQLVSLGFSSLFFGIYRIWWFCLFYPALFVRTCIRFILLSNSYLFVLFSLIIFCLSMSNCFWLKRFDRNFSMVSCSIHRFPLVRKLLRLLLLHITLATMESISNSYKNGSDETISKQSILRNYFKVSLWKQIHEMKRFVTCDIGTCFDSTKFKFKTLMIKNDLKAF